ncbi:MAG: response regulator transcription factor [Phycisphaerae bacterium]|nr:response regulator transcription factor [Phycisphaerae bacterium]
MPTRILLVDDHEIMREGMCALLKRLPDIDIVGQASDGRSAISMAKEFSPDIVIMDIGMPNLNGIEATRQLLIDNPRLKVMALSTHSDGTIVAKMLKAGASGYMLKESAFSELMEGIAAMMEGKTYLCSRISKVVFSDYVTMLSSPQWSGGDTLTSRENEVLQLVAEGKTSKEISQVLNVSVKTIDSHREHIMEKLSIHNVAGLTKYAVREGITSPW